MTPLTPDPAVGALAAEALRRTGGHPGRAADLLLLRLEQRRPEDARVRALLLAAWVDRTGGADGPPGVPG